jgi:hypothetical protein
MADGSAADFVRGLSAELTLREMDAAVKAAGFKLSHQRTYAIRHEEKLGFKRGANRGRPKKKVAKVTARAALEAIPVKPTVTDNARVQVRKLALQIGLPRIEELVRELKREAGIE